jgi:hypothetical protein
MRVLRALIESLSASMRISGRAGQDKRFLNSFTKVLIFLREDLAGR